MAELYLFNQREEARKQDIINTLESILQEAGYSLLDEKKLPPSEEKALSVFESLQIGKTKKEKLKKGFSFFVKKLSKKVFYIIYEFKNIEIPPTEEDKKTFSEEFLKEAKKYKRSVEWEYFTGESKRLAGIRVPEPITEENPAFNLLSWSAFKEKNVEEETLLQIRKALNLEGHSFIYAPDYFRFGLATSLLALFMHTQEKGHESENPYFISMQHFQALDNFSLISSKNAKVNDLSQNKVLKAGEKEKELKVTVPLEGKNIGIQTDKLIRFSNNLIYETGSSTIYFSLDDYMRKLKYPIDADPDASDPVKEKKRAAAAYKDGRKKVSKELTTLYNASISYKQGSNFYDHRFLVGKGINGNMVRMDFVPEYVAALKRSHVITQYSNALFGLDPQEDANAYRIGKKMCEHFNNETNLAKGTGTRLKVSTLLAVTDLPKPTDENFKKHRLSWENRIKDPFDNALEKLKAKNVLDNYEYVHSKGVKLTDDEAENINSYTMFSSLYVEFVLSNAPDHTEGIEKKKAKAKARKKRREKENK